MKKIITLSMLTTFASINVYADTLLSNPKPNIFNYNYVEVNYVNVDDIDVDGFSLRASKDIDPNLSIIGSLQLTSSENVDLTILSAGAAYHQQLQETEFNNADFIIHAEIENISTDINSKFGKKHNHDDNGLLIGAGLRDRVVANAEVFADLSLRTAGDTDFLATIGGRYSFTPVLQGMTSLEIGDNNTLSLGVRYNY